MDIATPCFSSPIPFSVPCIDPKPPEDTYAFPRDVILEGQRELESDCHTV